MADIIENLRLGNDLIKFNPEQVKFINKILNPDLKIKLNEIKQFIYFGGFRSGKSFIVQLITFLLCCVYPNLRVVYVRRTYDQLKDSVIKQFCDDFQKYGMFKYIETSKDGSRMAKFTNGSTIRFRAFDRDTNILSAEYDVACMCQAEEVQEELYKQLFGRLSGHIMSKTILMAEGNPKGNWVKNTFYDLDESQRIAKGIYFINAPTISNLANLPADYVETLKQQYSEKDFQRWVMGDWQNLYGSVFDGFKENINVIDPIPFDKIDKNEVKMIGGDYGFRNPTAFVWGFKDFDDNYIIFDEFYKSGCLPEEIVRENLRHGKLLTAMDNSIKRPDRDGKNLWDDLINAGLLLIEPNKDEHRNIVTVNSLFVQKKLKICSNCRNLISEIKKYKYPEQKIGAERNFNESPIDKDNHAIDAMLYLIAEMENRRSVTEYEKMNKKSIHSLTVARSFEGISHYG